MPPAAISEAKQPRAYIYASGLGDAPNALLLLKRHRRGAKTVWGTVLARGNPCQGFPHAALRGHPCYLILHAAQDITLMNFAANKLRQFCDCFYTVISRPIPYPKIKAGHPRHSSVLLQFLRSYARVVLLRNISLFDASNGKGFLPFFHLRELRSPAESRGVKEQKTVHPPAQRENAPSGATTPSAFARVKGCFFPEVEQR